MTAIATDCSKFNFKRKMRRMKIFESFMFYLLTEGSFYKKDKFRTETNIKQYSHNLKKDWFMKMISDN